MVHEVRREHECTPATGAADTALRASFETKYYIQYMDILCCGLPTSNQLDGTYEGLVAEAELLR